MTANVAEQAQQLWCIRHGERMEDCSDYKEDSECPENRRFDLGLSAFGIGQARNLGKILRDSVKNKPRCIYVSPMLRTLQTAFEVCKILAIDMVVVPGLALSAHIVRKNGISFNEQHQLVLTQNDIEGIESTFLSNKEISNQFECKEVAVSFIDVIHQSFNETIQFILSKTCHVSGNSTTLICSHRETSMDFIVDHKKFNLKRNAFGKVIWRRKKHMPIHCEMFKYKCGGGKIWYNGRLEDDT